MSKIAVSPNGSGTGTYTLASPNNNASHTLTLPVATGELLTSTGNGSGLTSLTSSNLTGALPAISGSSLTSLTSANLTGALPAISGSSLTSLTSANLTGALPAIDGSSLTSLTSANLTGALPAIDGSALTGVGPATRTWSSQSKGLNGTYTNSTGHDIVVFVCWWNNATNRICSWFVGGHTTAGFSTYAGDGSSMIVVPNGAQYRFNSQSNTLRSWSELR